MYTRRAASTRGSTSYFIQLSDTLRRTPSTYQPKRLPKSPVPPLKLNPPLAFEVVNEPYGPLTGPPCPKGILLSSSFATCCGGGFFCVVGVGPFFFVSFSGMGIAFGSSFGVSFGFDSVSPFDSLANTFCVSVCGLGKGMVLTSVALMAPPPPVVPPQLSPRLKGIRYPKSASANNAPCSAMEPIKGPRTLPSAAKMSASAGIALQRLRDDAHVGDTGLLHSIHDRGEAAEGHVFIGAHVHRLTFGIANLLAKHRADLVDVDRLAVQEDFLVTIDGDHQPLFGDFLHRLGVRHLNLDARLQYWRRDHEDNEQHQHHVDQWGDIDFGKRSLGAALSVGESH